VNKLVAAILSPPYNLFYRVRRKRRLLHGVNPARAVGLEIGPLDRPVVHKRDGKVWYVDIASEAALKDRYHNDPAVRQESICPVDFIWEGKPLRQIIPVALVFDYVIASHVIEHTVGMIAWLKEIAEVMKPGAVFSLAVPDKRFTFDRDRELTTLEDILAGRTKDRGEHMQVFTCDSFASIMNAICPEIIPFKVVRLYQRGLWEFLVVLQRL